MKNIEIAKAGNVRQAFFDGRDLSISLARDAVANLLVAPDGQGDNQRIEARLEQGSMLNLTILDAANGDMERVVDISLCGEHAQCTLNGVFVTSNTQKVANYVKISHLAEGCESSQNFRGVASGASRGFFRGHIYVDKQAQETVALQENHNILLSEKAKIETQPQLEIYADRVKCNHGATVGRQDEAAMFYCRQRGIGSTAARVLLTEGFCRAALPIEDFGEQIEIRILEKLSQKLAEL